MKGIRESQRREHLLVCNEGASGKDRDVFCRRAGGMGGGEKEGNPKNLGKKKSPSVNKTR